MQTETLERPEQTCQWCGGTIPADGDTCLSCGAIRPRDDLFVPGLTQEEQSRIPEPEPAPVQLDDDAEKARQILRDLDAYVSEDQPPVPVSKRDPSDDVIVIVGVLVVGAVLGGLTGWLIAPPLLHDFFESALGVESDGPEAFRRLGAFTGALVTMLFAALLATMIRR